VIQTSSQAPNDSKLHPAARDAQHVTINKLMSLLKISVVCCDDSPQKLSRIVETELEADSLDELILETIEQELAAGEAKDLHNAAHHAEHGPVTYLQQVREGGFSVLVGEPGNLKPTFFGAGTYVAFIDDEGPGHGSKVGPEGVKRTLRILKGHLKVQG
jgi:hypothetical protein